MRWSLANTTPVQRLVATVIAITVVTCVLYRMVSVDPVQPARIVETSVTVVTTYDEQKIHLPRWSSLESTTGSLTVTRTMTSE